MRRKRARKLGFIFWLSRLAVFVLILIGIFYIYNDFQTRLSLTYLFLALIGSFTLALSWQSAKAAGIILLMLAPAYFFLVYSRLLLLNVALTAIWIGLTGLLLCTDKKRFKLIRKSMNKNRFLGLKILSWKRRAKKVI